MNRDMLPVLYTRDNETPRVETIYNHGPCRKKRKRKANMCGYIMVLITKIYSPWISINIIVLCISSTGHVKIKTHIQTHPPNPHDVNISQPQRQTIQIPPSAALDSRAVGVSSRGEYHPSPKDPCSVVWES